MCLFDWPSSDKEVEADVRKHFYKSCIEELLTCVKISCVVAVVKLLSRGWASHCSVAEDSGRVGCDVVPLPARFPTLQEHQFFRNFRNRKPSDIASHP